MKIIRIAVACIILLIGMYLIVLSVRSASRFCRVQSDFKAFSARVAEDETGKHVLEYGGESDDTDFDYLIEKVGSLSDDWDRVGIIGMVLCGLGFLGIILESVERILRFAKRIEQKFNIPESEQWH